MTYIGIIGDAEDFRNADYQHELHLDALGRVHGPAAHPDRADNDNRDWLAIGIEFNSVAE